MGRERESTKKIPFFYLVLIAPACSYLLPILLLFLLHPGDANRRSQSHVLFPPSNISIDEILPDKGSKTAGEFPPMICWHVAPLLFNLSNLHVQSKQCLGIQSTIFFYLLFSRPMKAPNKPARGFLVPAWHPGRQLTLGGGEDGGGRPCPEGMKA